MFYTIIRILVIAVCCTAAGMSAAHMLQSLRYDVRALGRELSHYGGLLGTNVLVALITAVVNWYLPVLLSMAIPQEVLRETISNWLVLALFAGVTVILFFQKKRIPQRKPFAWTHRIVRLLVLVFCINLGGATLLGALTLSPYLMFAGAEYIVFISAFLLRPLEDAINARHTRAAKKKLASMKKLVKIGITGSYGKTDTKLILRTILSEKFRVLATPPSFSTTMGVVRMINEQLGSNHQVFISEMGAQQKGEIKEMAKLLRPQYGIITCVSGEHLNVYGSLEAIAQAKYALIQSLPQNGEAFFGSDGSYGDRLYALCKATKFRAGVQSERECFMQAEHVETGVKGTRFELICADGESIWVQTALLGISNVRDIALAAAVARRMGMTMEEIAHGIGKLKPRRHRLQLIPCALNIIDDSENELPKAALDAVQILAEFPGRRILVTSGLSLSQGATMDDNYAFGAQIAACADYVVLVGKEEVAAIMRGLTNEGFPKSSVRMVQDEEDAVGLVQEMVSEGDSILYEGVYPDGEDDE